MVSVNDLPDLIEYEGVNEVIVAKRDFPRTQHRELVDFLHPYPITIKVVPCLDELASGKVSISSARPVRVEDVLGRDPVRPRGALLMKAVAGKSVLVTGAGGSIGSEIVRQTQRHNPSKLILLDNNEFALFEIHREIEACGSSVEFKSILGSVMDEGFIEIKFVELHDGQKLYEELLTAENVSATAHERIMQCEEYFLPPREIEAEIANLRRLLELGDAEGLKSNVMRLATPPGALTRAAASGVMAMTGAIERVCDPSRAFADRRWSRQLASLKSAFRKS